MQQNKAPIEEFVEHCRDDLLTRILDVYIKHRQEGREQAIGSITALFATILEERLNARKNDH